MKYLCVGYYDQGKMDALTSAQVDTVMSECPPLMDEFHGSGRIFLEAGIDSEIRVMRRVGGEVRIADSPKGEGREVIGCVFFVEAPDIEEATRVASLHPTTRIAAGENVGFRIGISAIRSLEERKLIP